MKRMKKAKLLSKKNIKIRSGDDGVWIEFVKPSSRSSIATNISLCFSSETSKSFLAKWAKENILKKKI